MAKTNRTCYTCGKAYLYCPTCSGGKEPLWKDMHDTQRCKDIFDVLSQEHWKHITKEEAKTKLLDMKVSVSEDFNEGIKKHIKDIIGGVKIETKKIEAPVIESNNEEETTKKSKFLKKKKNEEKMDIVLNNETAIDSIDEF